jgi:hypothetical protein
MIVLLCIIKYDAKHLQVSKDIKLLKIQGFMFISKTICYKPCTTNQKQKKLNKGTKDMKLKKRNGNYKQREKNLLKKYRFSILDSRPFPILARRNARG